MLTRAEQTGWLVLPPGHYFCGWTVNAEKTTGGGAEGRPGVQARGAHTRRPARCEPPLRGQRVATAPAHSFPGGGGAWPRPSPRPPALRADVTAELPWRR